MPAFVNSLALKTISSRLGVIKPDRPIISAFSLLATSMIV
jgi:hypothetical protein